MCLAENLNTPSDTFPEKERFNLKSQLRRAADSIALNIAEGSILQSKLEFRKFLGYSIRSLAEVVNCLHKANNREYLTKNGFSIIYKDAFNLMNIMVAFRKTIK